MQLNESQYANRPKSNDYKPAWSGFQSILSFSKAVPPQTTLRHENKLESKTKFFPKPKLEFAISF